MTKVYTIELSNEEIAALFPDLPKEVIDHQAWVEGYIEADLKMRARKALQESSDRSK